MQYPVHHGVHPVRSRDNACGITCASVCGAVLKGVADDGGRRAVVPQAALAAARTRLFELLEEPSGPERAPRVLGVDEFAFRRGRRYGTILVDVETGRVVDVLPGRISETFAAWLTSHPGAEMAAATAPAPTPRPSRKPHPKPWRSQIAGTCYRTCPRRLRRPATSTAPACANASTTKHRPRSRARRSPSWSTCRHPRCRRQRWSSAPATGTSTCTGCWTRGWTISAIARHLGLDRKTVRKFKTTDLDLLLASARDRRPDGVLEPFKPYVNSRFAAGCTSRTRLFREITERGNQGSVQVVRKHLAALRTGTAEPAPAAAPPRPRKITSWIMRDRDRLSADEVEQLDRTSCI